jgi:hypothetical protein
MFAQQLSHSCPNCQDCKETLLSVLDAESSSTTPRVKITDPKAFLLPKTE